MVKTYLLDCSLLYNEEYFTEIYNKLTNSRKEKVFKYKEKKDQVLSLGSTFLLEYLLNLFSIDKNENIIYNEHNKPYLENNNLYFNISHSNTLVVCSISDSEIGVDVESVRDFNPKLKYYINKEEEFINFKTFYNLDEITTFYRLWALKESFMKYSGIGLGMNVKSLYINPFELSIFYKEEKQNVFFTEYKYDDYVISVCSIKEKSEFIIENIKDLLRK